MSWNVTKVISPQIQCTSNTNRVLSFSNRFTSYYNCMSWNVRKNHLREFSAQASQIVFLAYLTVLRLLRTVWAEMSENSYLREFSAKVSQVPFLAFLTDLRLINSVEAEMSENFIPFYGWLQRKTHISAISVHKYHKSCFSFFDRFIASYSCMS